MEGAPLELESFSNKEDKVERVLGEEENDHFLASDSAKVKIKGFLTHISSVPCCEICDNSLKRLKLSAKVSIFLIGMAACIFLSSKLSPFFPQFMGFSQEYMIFWWELSSGEEIFFKWPMTGFLELSI
jgi:hypothetical protein